MRITNITTIMVALALGSIPAVSLAGDAVPEEVKSGERVCKGTAEKPIVLNVRKGVKVTVQEWCTVHAFAGSEVWAESGDSEVWAKAGSMVWARTNSHVTAESGSTVAALADSHVNALPGSNVIAFRGSNVYADNGAEVEKCSDTAKIYPSRPDAQFVIKACNPKNNR